MALIWSFVLTVFVGCRDAAQRQQSPTTVLAPVAASPLAAEDEKEQNKQLADGIEYGYDAPLHTMAYEPLTLAKGQALLLGDPALKMLEEQERIDILFALRLDAGSQYWVHQVEDDWQKVELRRLTGSKSKAATKTYRKDKTPIYLALAYPEPPSDPPAVPPVVFVTFAMAAHDKPVLLCRHEEIDGFWEDCCILDLNNDGLLEVILPTGWQKRWQVSLSTVHTTGELQLCQVDNTIDPGNGLHILMTWCGRWCLQDFDQDGLWEIETVWRLGAERDLSFAFCNTYDPQSKQWRNSSHLFAAQYSEQREFYDGYFAALAVARQNPEKNTSFFEFRGKKYEFDGLYGDAYSIESLRAEIGDYFIK